MNFPRKTIFWVLVLLLLGGSFYFVDEKVEEEKKLQEAALRLFSFSTDEVTEFWIRNASGDKLRLEKKDEEWWLTEPLSVKGDKEAVEAMLKNVVGARRDGILFENPLPAKLVELGLDEPSQAIGFVTDSLSLEIGFGDKGPTNNVAYAIIKGDPKVYRIHSDIAAEADKDLYALRDKTIFDFDPQKVEKIVLEKNGGRMVIEQPKSGKWDLTEPIAGPASMEKVLETLYRVKEEKIKAFESEEPRELEKYGLVAPTIRLTITVKGEKGNIDHILEVGKKDRERRGYFAKRGGSGGIFVVEEVLVNHFYKDAAYWSD